jgi:hypothetical protein
MISDHFLYLIRSFDIFQHNILLTKELTSWTAGSSSATQEFPTFIWNPEVLSRFGGDYRRGMDC